MQELFNAHKIVDWGPNLSQLDETTGLSREVTDDEVLAFGVSLDGSEDPTGIHLLNKLRTNQFISKFQRGAIQLGYQRQHFKPETHMRDGQTAEICMVHSSCAMLLSKVVAKVGGYRQYTVLTPRSETIPDDVLCIDPFGMCLMYTWNHCPIQLLAMMVDLDIPMTAKFTSKLTKARQRGGQVYQGNALRHIPEGGYLPPGQRSIVDQPVTAEEVGEPEEAYATAKAAAKSRAKAKAKSPPEPPGPPPQQDRWNRNQQAYDRWQGGRYNQRRWNNDRWDG